MNVLIKLKIFLSKNKTVIEFVFFYSILIIFMLNFEWTPIIWNKFYMSIIIIGSLLFSIIMIYIPRCKKNIEFNLLEKVQTGGILLFCIYFSLLLSLSLLLLVNLNLSQMFLVVVLLRNFIKNIKIFLRNNKNFDFTLKERMSFTINFLSICFLTLNNKINFLIPLSISQSLFFIFWIVGLFIMGMNGIFLYKTLIMYQSHVDKEMRKSYAAQLINTVIHLCIIYSIYYSKLVYIRFNLNLSNVMILGESYSISISQLTYIFFSVMFLFGLGLSYFYYNKNNLVLNKRRICILLILYFFFNIVSFIILRPLLFDLGQYFSPRGVCL